MTTPDGVGVSITVQDLGKAALVRYGMPVFVDMAQYSTLVLTYRSEAQQVSWENAASVTADCYPTPDIPAVALVMLSDLRHDGEVHTLRIDLKEALADRPDFPRVVPRLNLWAYGGAEGPGTLEVLDLRFEAGDPADSAAPAQTAGPKPPLRVQVQDADGQPIAGAEVELDPVWPGQSATVPTDGSGLAVVSPTDPQAPWARRTLKVSAPGRTEVRFADVSTNEVAPDDTLVVTLYNTTTVGGRVVDAEGQPVPRATGWLETRYLNAARDRQGRPVAPEDQPVVADEEGRWRLEGQADDPDATFRVGWRVPGYVYNRNAGDTSGQLERDALKQHEAVSRLTAGPVLQGVVTATDGRPLVGILVVPERSGWLDRERVTRTDTEGRFRLEGLVDESRHITAIPQGDLQQTVAPVMRTVESGASAEPLHFVLPPASRYAFRVTDAQGRPVPDATIQAGRWESVRYLSEYQPPVVTDADGHAVWYGPATGVEFAVYARDRMSASGLALMPNGDQDPPHPVVLNAPLVVSLRAVDTATGETIDAFEVDQGIRFAGHDPTDQWLEHEPDAPIVDGRWTQTYTQDYSMRVFRLRAKGYAMAITDPIPPDAGEVNVVMELRPAEGIGGAVVGEAGRAVAGATVYLAEHGRMPFIRDGAVSQQPPAIEVTTDAQGRFNLPNARDTGFTLIALHPDGIAWRSSDDEDWPDATGDLQLRLMPWGRLEGVIFENGRPAAGQKITGHHQPEFRTNDEARRHQKSVPHSSVYGTVNADGTFAIERVIPGVYHVGLLVPTGGGMSSTGTTHRMRVEAGQTATMSLGTEGRPITARLAWPDPNDTRPLHHGHVSIDRQLPPDIAAALRAEHLHPDWDTLTDRERQEFLEIKEGRIAQARLTEAIERANGVEVLHRPGVEPDGTVSEDALRPGTYRLSMTVTAPPERPGWPGRQTTGRVSHTFEVPELPDGVKYLDEPLASRHAVDRSDDP